MATPGASSREAVARTLTLMLVGSSQVGKTYLAERLSGSEVGEARPDATYEPEKKYWHVAVIGGATVGLRIFDTSGVARTRTSCLWRCENNSIDAFILVFSIFDSKSFQELPSWIEQVQIKVKSGARCRFYLIGNCSSGKADRSGATLPQVEKSTMDAFTRQHHIPYCEYAIPAEADTSCVKSAFHRIAQDLLEYAEVASPAAASRSLDLGQPGTNKVAERTHPDPLTSALRANQIDRLCDLLNAAQHQPLLIGCHRDRLGRSLLAVAARCSHPETLHTLLSRSEAATWARLADVPDNAGMTPLMLAAAAGHAGKIVRLHELGADVNKQDRLKFTALTHAACRGHTEVVARLLAMQAAAHVPDFCGNTPLIWAARTGFVRVIGELRAALTLDQLRHAGEYGMNALQWAHHFGHRDCQEELETCTRSLLQADSPDLTAGTAAMVVSQLLETVPAVEAWGPFYSMQRPTRGYAMIVNIVDFPAGSGLPRRDGAEVDSQETGLYQAFAKMGFTPILFQNSDGQFFQNLMENNCPLDKYADHDAFLVYISSHGGLGFVYASDGTQVLLEGIFDQVRRRPELYGKPKIFVVQGCRDTQHQPQPTLTVPKRHEDCLYLYSVVEGGTALRNTDTGCLFTNALRNLLMSVNELPIPEFLQLIPQVVDQVATETNNCQIVTSTSTLRRLLFFPPRSRWASDEDSHEL